MALLLASAGLGVLLLAGFAIAMVFTGGTALLLLLKLGKLLIVLALPLWYLVRVAVRALFIRLPAPTGRELKREEAPALFAALADLRRRMKGPRFHHVLLVDDVNAAVVQRPAFGLVGWPRNYLLLGLPLLEAMPAVEAMAVVAHEYGHLAGSHGHFSAFIYRLRHTWGTVQAYADQISGWLGRPVAWLVRWYAPYFNAYTFVLARADEYRADADAAMLVGAANAASALKRVNVVAPHHQRFLQQTFDRIDHDPQPPADLMRRWATTAEQAVHEGDARRWLADALDRPGDIADTHPTLRLRLAAMIGAGPTPTEPPPLLQGPSAAHDWLGSRLETLRAELQSHWANAVAPAWSERHAEAQRARRRLIDLRAQPTRGADQELEMHRLTLRLEPDTDLRQALAAFNAAHPDYPLGLYLEGTVRLAKGDREGLRLLDRAMTMDPEATKPACGQAYAFLSERKETEAAEGYAERWRRRDEMETLRARQLHDIDSKDPLAAHGLDAPTLQAVRARLDANAMKHVVSVFLARRVIPADPTALQYVMAVQVGWWARQRSKQREAVDRLAALDWPVSVVVLTLDGRFARMKRTLEKLPGSQIA